MLVALHMCLLRAACVNPMAPLLTSLGIQPHVSDKLEEAMVILAFSVLSSENEKLL